MAGLALTNEFMLGTATVMIGAPADLFDLKPATNSIGLVKNFTITADPTYTELTQGVQNTIVDSVLTGNPVKSQMEVFEYTAKNIAYGLGLDATSAYSALSVATTTSGTGSPNDTSVVVASATGIVTNDYIMIKIDTDDHVIIRKVTNVVSNTLTVSPAIVESIPASTPVVKVNMISGGKKTAQPFYSAAVAGQLTNGEQILLLLPKVRIVKGFSLAFRADNYGNLPFEFTSYDLVSTDPFYSTFAGDQFRIFKQK